MPRHRTGGAALLVAAALSSSGFRLPLPAGDPGGDASASATRSAPDAAALAVWDGAHWRTWWNEESAPAAWHAPHPVVSRAVEWRPAGEGVDLGTVRFSGAGVAWRFNVALLRVDPRRIELGLHVKRSRDGRALPWSVEELPADAAFAINAGMFDAVGPWGWIVLDGDERQAPGAGPLSSALVIGRDGEPRIVSAREIEPVRRAGVRWAVQSYPTALVRGEVPVQLREPGHGVDVAHRDARLALAMMHDGHVLVALTRFDGLAGLLDAVPLGPTLPEMTAILGALGARDAMFLDGGISAQMAVRTPAGVERFDGLRKVPLALVGATRR